VPNSAGTRPPTPSTRWTSISWTSSNALRHGGGSVAATVRETSDAYLVEVSDAATTAPPTPAVGRDPSEGGLGLYLIAELATLHGWYVSDRQKHVWALLPRS
jgi:hypothetical protein